MSAAAAPLAEVVLPLLLPTDGRLLWVQDRELADALAGAGFEVTDGRSDVAVVTSAEELAAAPPVEQVVGILDGMSAARGSGGRLVDAAVRLEAHARVRRRITGLRRRLEEEGRPSPDVWFWDVRSMVWSQGEPSPVPLHRADRYLRRASLTSGVRGPRLVEAALQEAAGATQPPPHAPRIDHVVVTEGSTVAVTDVGVLRVGLGSRVGQVEQPAAVLRSLGPVLSQGPLRAAVPELLAEGWVGALRWSLEGFLDGGLVVPPLTDAQWRACVALQVGLHALPAKLIPPGPRLGHLADMVADHAGDGALVRRLAADAERHLNPWRGGVNHGDFWHSNLLGDDNGITGLLDWDSARGEGLPFVDLLHLYTASVERPGRASWGTAFVGRTLPWLVRAEDPHLRAYAAGTGVPLDRETLGAAAVGYWLLHLGYQLSRYPRRAEDPRWVTTNIDRVAAALERFVEAGR